MTIESYERVIADLRDAYERVKGERENLRDDLEEAKATIKNLKREAVDRARRVPEEDRML